MNDQPELLKEQLLKEQLSKKEEELLKVKEELSKRETLEKVAKDFCDAFGSIRAELKAISQKVENAEKDIAYHFPPFKEAMKLVKSKSVQTSLDDVDFKRLKSELQKSKDGYAFQSAMEKYPDHIVFAFAEFLGVEKLKDRDEAIKKIGQKLNASRATNVGSLSERNGSGSAGKAGGKNGSGFPAQAGGPSSQNTEPEAGNAKPHAEIVKHAKTEQGKTSAGESDQPESGKSQQDSLL